MAVTDKQVADWFAANPGATDAQIAQAAKDAGVSASQLSRVTGVPVSEVVSRVGATDVGTLSKNVTADTIQSVADQILAQGTTSKWTGEGAGSAEKNALWMADTLSKAGITDISQFGEIQQTVQGDPIYAGSGEGQYIIGYGPDKVITTYGNKETGQALPNTYGERQTGNAFGGTYAGEGNTAYRVQFDAQGNPIFYTTGASSSDIGDLAPLLTIGSMLVAPGLSGLIGGATGLTGGALAAATGATLGAGTAALTDNNILKGALLGGAGGYLGNTLFGGGSTTDLGMNSNLTMAQIESGLGTAGYGYNAGAANSGLFNAGTIGSGAYTQTSYPYDMSELLAADTQNLFNTTGGNIPAIEQNLVASGVDPLVAADVANQITLNPNISTYDLTNYINTNFGGGNLYDVNTTDITDTTDTKITKDDILEIIKTGSVIGTVLGVEDSVVDDDTGFEIVPVPSDWKTPTYGQTGQWPALTPIDFGSRELLRGTQWEKYINPAQPVTPVQAPTGMNYGQLMNVLQGGQGGTLSLNDIISGIQSQYGQTNTGSVGK